MKRFSTIPLLLVVLSACTMGPAYEKPDMKPPATWQAEAGTTAAAAGVWPDPKWWQGFGSSELGALIEQAIAGNQDLQAAAARVMEAEAQAKIASAPLFPTLGLGGTGSRNSTGGANGGRAAVTTSYQGSASAAYQVDLFGRNRAASAAAETRVQSSRFDQQTVAITVQQDVAATYFQVLALRDRVRLAQDQVGAAQNILGLLEQQQRIGTISDLEVAQQRSAIATQRASIAALRQSERETIDALALLLGRFPEGFAVKQTRLSEIAHPAVVAGLPSQLLQRRPDILRAEADLRAANFDIVSARAARFPSIQLTAQGGTVSTALSGLFGPGTWFTALAAGITAPLFQGGELEGQEESARARYKELVTTYATSVYSAFSDVENALSATQLYGERYRFARDALDQARLAYRLADIRYRAGTVDFITVLNAQQAVFQANDTLVQAELAQLTALTSLYAALGGGWTPTGG